MAPTIQMKTNPYYRHDSRESRSQSLCPKNHQKRVNSREEPKVEDRHSVFVIGLVYLLGDNTNTQVE